MMPYRDFQPLAPPDALDPFVVDDPSRLRAQQFGDLPIAEAAVLSGQLDNVAGQPLLVVSPFGNAARGGSMLPEHPASPALRQPDASKNLAVRPNF
jgi:hypothetical protein